MTEESVKQIFKVLRINAYDCGHYLSMVFNSVIFVYQKNKKGD